MSNIEELERHVKQAGNELFGELRDKRQCIVRFDRMSVPPVWHCWVVGEVLADGLSIDEAGD